MKNTYIVERMTAKDYTEYMRGGYNYNVETLTIVANTAEEAAAIAKIDGYVVNENYVKTAEEIAAKEAERKAYFAAEEAKREAAKVKREAKEAEKAAAAGMTVIEYRAAKAKAAAKRRLENEIAKLEAELAAKRAKLARM